MNAANYIVSFFKGIWRSSCWLTVRSVRWMDAHHGFMTFVATAVITWLTWNIAVYSRNQWRTMEQQLDLSQRPWVEPKMVTISPLVFQNGRWSANVNSVLKNHGESVALNVGHYAEMFPLHKDTQFGPAIRRQEQWCDANRHPKPSFATGYILFPKETQPLLTGVGVSVNEISTETTGLVIAGCVHYRASYDAPNRQTRQTRFAYLLSISDKDAILGVPASKDPTKVFLLNLPALWSAD